MKLVWLVINGGLSSFAPHKDRYRAFDSWPKAVTYAKSIGWTTVWFDEREPKPGVMAAYKCDKTDVSIIGLEQG